MLPLTEPVYYSLELTAVCNSLCPVCSNVFLRHKDVLGAVQWRQVLDKIAAHAQAFKLTGGEATLHPEFSAIIEAVVETGVPFALFTNGRWPNPQATINLLQKSLTCSGLLISLHGHDADSHVGFTHTPNSFAETCENIRRAAAAGLNIHTSTVLTRHNWNQVQEIVELSQSLGAKRAVFNRYLGPPMPEIEPEPWQIRTAVQDIERLMQRMNTGANPSFTVRYGNCIPQCFTPSSSTGCWAGVAYCTIDPWGNVRPCNHSPTIVGNLFAESIETLWHNKTMNHWRELMPSQCHTCTEFGTCRGGCRALVEIRERDPLIHNPVHKQTLPPTTIKLFEAGRPSLNCKVKPEPFGYALIRGHSLLQVTQEAQPLLNQLNGTTCLHDIQERFGQEGLDLVGHLYSLNLLSIEQ